MTMNKRILALASVLALFVASRAAAETYTIDPVHSSVNFSLRHIVSKFTAGFTKVSGTVSYDAAAPEKSSVDATVDIASLNTSNEKRNGHLSSPDFFDTAKFPAASFKSTSWVKTGEDKFDVTGDLTIKGVTKSVVLKVALLGTGPGMGGATVSGWEATTTINKSDFGVNGPAMLGKALGDEVTLNLAVEAGFKAEAK
jgi:polyisoprenoid-binding protein YceI